MSEHEAFRADIVWEANLGKLRADLGEAGAIYAQTTAGMSEDALALAVKQDRLNRAIRSSGPESTAAKAATLSYRQELERLAAVQTNAARTVKDSARAEVTAAVEKQRTLATLAGEYRSVAAAAVKGSEEQVAATRLAIRAEEQLAAAARVSGASVVAARSRGAKAAEEEANAVRFGRGLAVGGGTAGRALAFGSNAFIGGLGTALLVKEFLGAAKNEELALALVRNALKDTGQSETEYGHTIEETTNKLESSSAFTKHELLGSLALLIRRTGDVRQSLDLMGTATDLARGRGIDLSLATGIIIRALNGQVGSLKRAGIEAVKVTTAQDNLRASGEKASAAQEKQAKALDAIATQEGIIAAVRQKYGQAAAAFLDTEAGKQALLNARMHDSEAIIGRALAPAYDHLLDRAAKYLDHLNKTGQLEREVNKLLHEGGTAAHELGDAFHFVDDILGPVVHALGGVEQTAKILLTFKLAMVIRGWAGSFDVLLARAGGAFTGIAASAGAATAKVEADAVAIDSALTKATRPREIIITETVVGGGVGGIPGLTPGLGRNGTLAGRIGQYGRNPVPEPTRPGIPGTGGLAGLALAGLVLGQQGEQGSYTVAWDQKEDQYYLVTAIGKTVSKDKISSAQAKKADPAFWTKIENFKRAFARAHASGAGGAAVAGRNAAGVSGSAGLGGGGGGAPPPKTGLPFRLLNEQADAEGTRGTADDLRVYKEEQAYLLKLLAQPGLTHADILSIKGQLNSYTAQIQSIEDAQNSAAKAAFDKRRSNRLATVATMEGRLKNDVLRAKTPAQLDKAEDALVAFYKREAHDAALSGKQQEHFAGLALKEEKNAKTRADKLAKQTRDARISRLEKIPVDLQIKVAAAIANGASDERLLALYRKEDQALKRQIAELRRIHASKEELLAALKNDAAVVTKINAITKNQQSSAQASEMSFLSEFASIVSRFAPNAFPVPSSGAASTGKTNTHLYDLVTEARKQTDLAEAANRRRAFPASGYSAAAAEAVVG